ncbi:hypothetical protein ACN1C3_14800 [Pseudomonas sp. H11T01]|uniref:hypothetical protein n=1 Tax=Pseudomonas sp. H11T01 TaxID=3402749 RepID=UPI003AC31375
MSDDRKERALLAWRKLLEDPKIRMNAEAHYNELLKAADELERNGIIDSGEWRKLVREAGTAFTNAKEGLGGGT